MGLAKNVRVSGYMHGDACWYTYHGFRPRVLKTSVLLLGLKPGQMTNRPDEEELEQSIVLQF